VRHALVALIAASLVVTATTQAREVRVMSAGATAPAYLQLVPAFESKTKQKAVTLATSTGLGAQAIVARVRAGEPVDVVLIASNVMDDLMKDGVIRKDSRIDIARSSIGMAVRAGARKPDITTIDGLKQAILNARSISISSQISGLYLTNELFPKLGVAEQAAPKTIKVEKGVAGDLVASGEAEIAFQQISELRAVKGIDYVGPLPAAVQRVSVFSAGIAAKAPNPAGAKALLDLLMSAEGRRIMQQSGLDPIAPQ
jgi:molybdate transport system substrate-binding protein